MFTATYSSEKIRKALVTLVKYQELKRFRKAALKIGISKSTIHRWWHSFHMLLGVRSRHQKRKKRRPRKRKFDGLVQQLQEIFSSQTTLQYHTLRAIRALLPENMQTSISQLHILACVLHGSQDVASRLLKCVDALLKICGG